MEGEEVSTKNVECTKREIEKGRERKRERGFKERARSCGLNVLAAICLRPQRNDVIYKPLS